MLTDQILGPVKVSASVQTVTNITGMPSEKFYERKKIYRQHKLLVGILVNFDNFIIFDAHFCLDLAY